MGQEFLERISKIAGFQVKAGQKISCLSKDHEDNNPSMMVYVDGAKCFSAKCGYYISDKKLTQKERIAAELINIAAETPPVVFAKTRKYDLEVLRSINIGKITASSMFTLYTKFPREECQKEGFCKKDGKSLLFERVCIPHSPHYFSARLQRKSDGKEKKNLFIKGLNKIPLVFAGDKPSILCEGETDAIALKHLYPEHQIVSFGGVSGVEKVLEQVQLNDEVWICFDNDEAGENATKKAAVVLLKQGKNLKRAVFDPLVNDIDDLWYEHQHEALKKIEWEPINYDVLLEDVDERFKDPNLLKYISDELQQDHIGDYREVLATFLVAATSCMPLQEDRMSIALKGNSAAGKDNCAKAVLKHIPDALKLTGATKAVLEDDIENYDLVWYSEVNMHRENGANKDIVETIKQLTEGGIHVMKKDRETNFATVKDSIQEQKTVIYGTTESDTDDELSTRFIMVTILSDEEKNRRVNKKTLEMFSDIGRAEKLEKDTSWVQEGLKDLKKVGAYVVIPYANMIATIKGMDLMDSKVDRTKRDMKRLMAFTCAISWIHQLQRKTTTHNGRRVVLSEPVDFINALEITRRFFIQTSKQYDARLQTILDIMDNQKVKPFETAVDGKPWYNRADIQTMMGVSKNTIKDWFAKLSDLGEIQGKYVEGVASLYRRGSVPGQSLLTGLPPKDIIEHIRGQWTDRVLTGYCTGTARVSLPLFYPILCINNKDGVSLLENDRCFFEKPKKTGKKQDLCVSGKIDPLPPKKPKGARFIDYVKANPGCDIEHVKEVIGIEELTVQKALNKGFVAELKAGRLWVL